MTASLRTGWALFLAGLPPMLPRAKWRGILLWCAGAAVVVIALSLLIPYNTMPERVAYIAALVLLVCGFTAGLRVLAVTRKQRRALPNPDISWSSQEVIDRLRKSGGRYEDLPRPVQDQMIAQAEHQRQTLPVTILFGLLLWVPFGLGGVIALAVFPAPQSVITLLLAILNLALRLGELKQLAATNPIIEFRDSLQSS